MDSLQKCIDDAIESHGLADGLSVRISNQQLYLMVNTLITNQSVALQAEFNSLHRKINDIGRKNHTGMPG